MMSRGYGSRPDGSAVGVGSPETALDLRTTVEVIPASAHLRARHSSRAEAVVLASAYAELLTPLLPVPDRASADRL